MYVLVVDISTYLFDAILFFSLNHRVVKLTKERKLKERQEKKVFPASTASAGQGAAVAKAAAAPLDRRHLHNYRVVQRNLVYVIGIPASIASEDTLRKAEYFGQYGKITKTVIHKISNAAHATASAYVTFAHKDDARACIQALEGFWIEGHHIRASFGTTKYCNNFIKGAPCNNPECVYLHDLGEDEDRFTKEEIQAGYSKLVQAPGKDQILVTGNGGPSGTGRRVTSGEPVFPPPVFIQDIARATEHIAKDRAEKNKEIIKETDKERDANTTTTTATNNTNNNTSANNNPATGASPRRGPTSAGSANDVPAAVSLPPSVADARVAAKASESEAAAAEAKQSAPSLESPLNSLAPMFNGFGKSAIFPVPPSSFNNSVWTAIMQASTSFPDLSINPYGLLTLSISDLLELTLPPVDAIALAAWPRPQSYYRAGMNARGLTYTPAGPHVHNALAATMAADGTSNTPTAANSSSISTLKQMFPGVNMSFGGQPRGVSS